MHLVIGRAFGQTAFVEHALDAYANALGDVRDVLGRRRWQRVQTDTVR